MPRPALLFSIFLLNAAFPLAAEANASKPLELRVGDRVLVNGSLHRKCSAHVSAIPSPGFANLEFDRAGCGDSTVPYQSRQVQRINFLPSAHELSQGDLIVVKGHFGNECSGHVREISRSGYTSVDLDSLLCADTAALYKSGDVHKVSYVTETSGEDSKFSVGQKITAKGIHEGDVCRGEIRKLTDNGLAQVAFEEMTCAYGGKLYTVDELKAVKAVSHRHASGELIYQRVMREIASKKKTKKNARL